MSSDDTGPQVAVSPDAAAAHSMPRRRRRSRRAVALAVAADAVALVAFVVLGRTTHDEEGLITGTVAVAAPFLVGAAVGWVAVRAWWNPFRWWPEGVAVWTSTLVVGLALRRFVFDDDGERGTALAFVIVATVVTGVFLLGWRAVATELVRRRRHPHN